MSESRFTKYAFIGLLATIPLDIIALITMDKIVTMLTIGVIVGSILLGMIGDWSSEQNRVESEK